jgi:hypothetical protein
MTWQCKIYFWTDLQLFTNVVSNMNTPENNMLVQIDLIKFDEVFVDLLINYYFISILYIV